MNKSEVENIVKKEIKKFVDNDFDKELSQQLKKKGKSRDEMLNTIKDSLEAVFKVLWQKREFWKSDLR
ncbi:MAG: hypothetical protein ACOCVF_00180 [bacterium]